MTAFIHTSCTLFTFLILFKINASKGFFIAHLSYYTIFALAILRTLNTIFINLGFFAAFNFIRLLSFIGFFRASIPGIWLLTVNIFFTLPIFHARPSSRSHYQWEHYLLLFLLASVYGSLKILKESRSSSHSSLVRLCMPCRFYSPRYCRHTFSWDFDQSAQISDLKLSARTLRMLVYTMVGEENNIKLLRLVQFTCSGSTDGDLVPRRRALHVPRICLLCKRLFVK